MQSWVGIFTEDVFGGRHSHGVPRPPTVLEGFLLGTQGHNFDRTFHRLAIRAYDFSASGLC